MYNKEDGELGTEPPRIVGSAQGAIGLLLQLARALEEPPDSHNPGLKAGYVKLLGVDCPMP